MSRHEERERKKVFGDDLAAREHRLRWKMAEFYWSSVIRDPFTTEQQLLDLKDAIQTGYGFDEEDLFTKKMERELAAFVRAANSTDPDAV